MQKVLNTYTCVSILKNIVVALKRNYGDVT